MKERGRIERYKRVREGEKRQYQWVGDDEMREVRVGKKEVTQGKKEGRSSSSGKGLGVSKKKGLERKTSGKKESRVRDRREGRRVWPTLTEGYVRKERHKTPAQQYKITYTDGREEPKRRKRYVGRKRVMAGMDRPRKLKGREDFEGMAMQQDHRTAWDMVERQRRRGTRQEREERKDKGSSERKEGESLGKEPQRVRKRRRRKCERARNMYEYSRRRRVEEEVMEEREEVIRKRKEGGHREPVGWWERRWEREERAGLGLLREKEEPVGGEDGERKLRGEAGRMPSKEREEREEVDQVGRKREAGKVGSEGRNHMYGEDSRKYRERYTKVVGKREGERKKGWEGVASEGEKGKRRGSREVRNRRGRGKETYGGGLRKSYVRKSKGWGYTGRGEGYGRREESVRRGVKEGRLGSKEEKKEQGLVSHRERKDYGKRKTGRKGGYELGPMKKSMRRKKWWEREGVGTAEEAAEERPGRWSKPEGYKERKVRWEGSVRTLGEVLGPRYVGAYRSENQERRQLGENVRRSSSRRSKGAEEEWSMEVEAGRMREELKKERDKRAKAGARWRRRGKRKEWGKSK